MEQQQHRLLKHQQHGCQQQQHRLQNSSNTISCSANKGTLEKNIDLYTHKYFLHLSTKMYSTLLQNKQYIYLKA